MKYPKRLLSIAICLCMLVFAGYHFEKVKRLRVGDSHQVEVTREELAIEPEPRIVSREVPVILVHGFNQSNQFWKDVNVIDGMAQLGYVHMGDFIDHKHESPGCELKEAKDIEEGQSALYTLSMPDLGTLDIKKSAELLAAGVTHARERHQCDAVKIVGFSMGGVVIREYLTTCEEHGVSHAISVSSPHLGSEYAWLANMYKWVLDEQRELGERKPNGWRQVLLTKGQGLSMQQMKKALSKLAASTEVPIHAQSARMLTPPQEGNYLHQLNQRKHPEGVEYHCIITQENMFTIHWAELEGEWQKLRDKDYMNADVTAASMDLIRASLGKLGNMEADSMEGKFRGDGAVSCFSQNMNNIDAFKRSAELRAKVHQVESSHLAANIRAELVGILKE